jgi:hypothetical protein
MGLSRSLATLRLWADGHNVLDGQLGRVLERSKSLQYTTLTTLNALCRVLVNSKFLRPYFRYRTSLTMLRLSRIVLCQSDDVRLSMLRSTNSQNLYDQTKWILAGLRETCSEGGSDSDSSEDEADKTKV